MQLLKKRESWNKRNFKLFNKRQLAVWHVGKNSYFEVLLCVSLLKKELRNTV